ncbi:MAG TPA: hypothetical protein VMT46_04150 [Anaerolineaceae bacterium]|nr:hypothetical protein [Anaerolineaceae bacterium]
MDYGEVLSSAWRIIWKHKVLWIFGILASCSQTAGGSGSNSGFRFQGNRPGRGQTPFPQLQERLQEAFNQLQQALNQVPGWVWVLVTLLIVGLVVIAIFLATIGRIGLIHGVNRADDGAGRLSFSRLFNESLTYFWRLFFLNLLVGLVLLVVVLILIALGIAFSVATLGIGVLCLIPFVCLLVPAGWFIDVLVEQANIAVVSENLDIIGGLRRSWEVVTKNLGPYIIMALILFIGAAIISFIFAIPLIGAGIPAIASVISGGEQVQTGGIVASVILILLYLPILILLNGILRSYIISAWTLTYRRLTGRRGLAQSSQPTLAPTASGS